MKLTLKETPSGLNDIVALGATALQTFVPEPNSAFSLIGDVASAVTGDNPNLMGIDPEYRELLIQQMEFQEQTQQVNLLSNNEKTKHEARMAPIRNIRA